MTVRCSVAELVARRYGPDMVGKVALLILHARRQCIEEAQALTCCLPLRVMPCPVPCDYVRKLVSGGAR